MAHAERGEWANSQNAPRIWQAVWVQAVKDWRRGDLPRGWFYTPHAVWIASVIIRAGLMDETLDFLADYEIQDLTAGAVHAVV